MVRKSSGIEIVSEDPEVMALQAIIKGLKHMSVKALTPMHLHVLSSVELYIKVTKQHPTREQIATMGRMNTADFEAELTQLVDRRYLAEVVNTYGDLNLTYKLGSMGGTVLRQMLDRKKAKKV